MLQFDILTIFPQILDSYFNESILKIAQKKNKIKIIIHDIRSFAKDKRKTTDDTPYGGGPGMVMKIEPIHDCLKSIKHKKKSKVFIMDPAGEIFNQQTAKKYSEKLDQIIFICGRYEGFDERVYKLADGKISIGQYVLSGGELPAMIITEAITRLIPGVLGHEHSILDETFSPDLDYIEYPQYTRPETYKIGNKTYKVPPILLSGNHEKINLWRKKNAK
ncbi:MAG: tRNA (guanosine(37)-N1)-methyltransferase TrmD [Patescibacteria group bacterium]